VGFGCCTPDVAFALLDIIAGRVGFGTPLGFVLTFFAEDLMPDIAKKPTLSQ
jgi:hypothetical protein